MNVLVFEWFCGGGSWIDGLEIRPGSCSENQGGLLDQGMGMLVPLLVDLTRAGHCPVTLVDSRLMPVAAERLPSSVHIIPVDAADEVPLRLQEQVQVCDGTILIAPETDDCLIQTIQWLGTFQTRLLSPDLEFVQLTSNKQATIEHLVSHCVPCSIGLLASNLDSSDFLKDAGSSLKFPLVAKPIDGAGSWNVILVETPEAIANIPRSDQIRIEKFVPGVPTSVSVICHQDQLQILPPTEQLFDTFPFGNYVGARFPLEPALEERAKRLALRTIRALPTTRGYFGIDMILSHAGVGQDVVLEVNPRLTMSYVKLREICDFNIADRMVKSLENEKSLELSSQIQHEAHQHILDRKVNKPID